ncbi:unnamed protein product [Urochloa humidicola]
MENVPPEQQIGNVIEVENSDNSGEQQPQVQVPLLPDLNDLQNVQVFIPMDNGIPLQVMPEEIPESDLPQEFDQDMLIGAVRTFLPDTDPALLERQLQSNSGPFPNSFTSNAQATKAWTSFLAPGLGAHTVSVPRVWADFFTTMLMHPGSFQWAKNFLTSQALSSLHHQEDCMIKFSIPDKCPGTKPITCLNHLTTEISETLFEEEGQAVEPAATSDQKGKGIAQEELSPCTPPEDRGIIISPSTGPWSQALLAQVVSVKKNAQTLVETDVRRSDRKKNHLKGYKNNSCLSRNCMGCDKEPPTFSPSIIKNLGATFCKIDEAKLTKEALTKNRKVTVPGGPKPLQTKNKKKGDDDNDKAGKGNKKQTRK